jgi:CelD/BcsL family acetyltransferase involved in cellulose biosynthesis
VNEMLPLERFTSLDAVSDVYRELSERSQNLFASWEWVSTWWRHFGRGRTLAITVARERESGRAVAIAPLYLFSRAPLRVLRFAGHGAGDWLGPLCAPGDEHYGADALRATLAEAERWDILLAERVRSDDPAAGVPAGEVLRRESFPMLPFRGRTWEEILAERSANFRQQVRRRERRLASSGRLEFRLCSDPDRLHADLDVLFDLHAAHWPRGESSAFSQARRSFHRDFASLALERAWLRLWVMELDGRPVAAWYGFRRGNVEWYYQSGRDPALDHLSVGFVLMCHTIRSAVQDGMDAYWFLRGDEPYKDRFAEEDPGLETTAVAHGPRGRAALAAARALDRLPGAGRRFLRARLG